MHPKPEPRPNLDGVIAASYGMYERADEDPQMRRVEEARAMQDTQAKRVVAISQDPMCVKWMREAEQLAADCESYESEVASLRGVAQAVEKFCDDWSAPTRRTMHAHEWAHLLRAALAAAADAPQPEDEEERGEPGPCCDCEQGCVMEGGPCLHPPTCDHGKTEAHSYTFASVPRELRWCPGPSPAVLPQPKDDQR